MKIFHVAFVGFLLGAAVGVHIAPKTAGAGAGPAHAVLKKDAPVAHKAAVPVMVVEEEVPVAVMEIVQVPVMEVVVVDEGGSPSKGNNGGLSDSCLKQFEVLKASSDLQEKAEKCEQDSKSMDRVVDALETGNLTGATAFAAKTFEKCSSLTEDCAKQVAPHTVQKVRLAGLAVTKACHTQVEESHADSGGKCMKNMITGVMHSLKVQDLESGMTGAQKGLGDCMKIQHPCDFQFAPMVLIQVSEIMMQMELRKAMQAPQQKEIPITEVLLSGVAKGVQVSGNITAPMTTTEKAKLKDCEKAMVNEADRAGSEVQDIMKDVRHSVGKMEEHFQEYEQRAALRAKAVRDGKKANAQPVIVVQKQKKKALSLLSLQVNLRIGFHSHTVSF